MSDLDATQITVTYPRGKHTFTRVGPDAWRLDLEVTSAEGVPWEGPLPPVTGYDDANVLGVLGSFLGVPPPWKGPTPRSVAEQTCPRCGNPYTFGAHGPGFCIEREVPPEGLHFAKHIHRNPELGEAADGMIAVGPLFPTAVHEIGHLGPLLAQKSQLEFRERAQEREAEARRLVIERLPRTGPWLVKRPRALRWVFRLRPGLRPTQTIR